MTARYIPLATAAARTGINAVALHERCENLFDLDAHGAVIGDAYYVSSITVERLGKREGDALP